MLLSARRRRSQLRDKSSWKLRASTKTKCSSRSAGLPTETLGLAECVSISTNAPLI